MRPRSVNEDKDDNVNEKILLLTLFKIIVIGSGVEKLQRMLVNS